MFPHFQELDGFYEEESGNQANPMYDYLHAPTVPAQPADAGYAAASSTTKVSLCPSLAFLINGSRSARVVLL